MKKKLALLLAGVMALSMVPMTAFAKTTNRVTRVAVAQVDDAFTNTATAPALKMMGDDLADVAGTTTQSFQLTLTNAEWTDPAAYAANVVGMTGTTVTKLTAKSIIVEGMVANAEAGVRLPMLVDLTAKGDATVTVDPRESVFTAGEYKFATVTGGEVSVTSAGIKSVAEKGTAPLKDIVLEETVEGTIETGTLKFRLSKGWSFDAAGTFNAYPAGVVTFGTPSIDGRDLEVPVTVAATDKAVVITCAPTVSWDEDKVEAGDICEMTVEGAGVDKTTIEVAKAITYGFSWTAEDKDLKEIYWGNEGKTLKVTFEETIAESWLDGRRTQIEFNEEVKVTEVKVTVDGGVNPALEATYPLAANGTTTVFKVNDDQNLLTFTNNWTRTTGAVDVTFEFKVDVKPGYTGDITATLCGKGVESEELEAVLATAVAPVTVEVEKADVVLDYRHTAIGDIVITEAETGILEDGSVISFSIEKLEFDDEPEVEVVAGDLTIEDTWVDNGRIYIEIDEESVKEAATIKVTGASLYMWRDIPAGDYFLKLVDATESYIDDNNTTTTADDTVVVTQDDPLFNNVAWTTSSVKIANDYVSVVTAGRDVDDSTFTTTLEVTVGATEMKANDKAIALDVPAYISGGYTMLPVRAITEALSGTAIVRWDDVAKQVTITFGSRVIAMTVGSDVMTINGVEVPMLAKCEITDSRAFIPLRDMGYALGLNDAAINWNAETNTATLN